MISKDILIIWIGQSGINIAERFWDYAYESLQIPVPQKFTPNGNPIKKTVHEKLDITEYYTQAEIEEARRMFFYNLLDDKDRPSGQPKKYIPRSIFIDVESEPIKSFKIRNRNMFPKESFIFNEFGSYSTFARALRLGEYLKPYLLERIQSLIQTRAIQNLEGIILVHATGGGAGSGLLQNVFDVMKDQFSKIPILTFSIFPSQKLSANIVESYNTVFATSALVKNADGVILLDNDKILEMVQEKYQIQAPSFEDINLVISRIIFSILMQFAMPGAIMRMDFNKIFTNLVPYKYMKFILAGIAPFNFDAFSMNKSEEIVEELTNSDNYLVNVDFQTGKYTSAVFMFMGQLGPEIKTAIRYARERMNYMEWIPSGVSIAITPRKNMTLDGKPLLRQGIILANNTALRLIFQRVLYQFNLMFQKNAFLTHFQKENIESKEMLKSAAKTMLRMVKFYTIAEQSNNQ